MAAGCKAALIQRSCGYTLRPTLSISDIQKAVGVIREVLPECLVLVDNCYGEFTEEREPGKVGDSDSAPPYAHNPAHVRAFQRILRPWLIAVWATAGV